MIAVLVRTGKPAERINIANELEPWYKAINCNCIETISYSKSLMLLVDEEGIYNNKPMNRALYREDGKIRHIILGDFLIVGDAGTDFRSLTEDEAIAMCKRFAKAEKFIRVNGEYIII